MPLEQELITFCLKLQQKRKFAYSISFNCKEIVKLASYVSRNVLMEIAMKKIARGLIAAMIVLSAVYYIAVRPYVSLAMVVFMKDALQSFVSSHYVASATLFMGLYILCTAFSIPVAAFFTLTGGALFGFLHGFMLSLAAATIGATAAFLMVRYALGDAFQGRYAKEIVQFNSEVKQYGGWYILALRLLPAVPFFLVNALAGLTILPVRSFIIGTFVGMIPGCLAYTYAGHRLSTIHAWHEVLSPQIAGIFLLLGLLALIPVIIRHVYNRRVNGRR